jgi:hypothetical protein
MSRESVDSWFPRQSKTRNPVSVLRWLPVHNRIPAVIANPDCGPEVWPQLIPSSFDPLPVTLAESFSPHQKELRRVVAGVTQGELLRSLLIRSHPDPGASFLSLHGQNSASVGSQLVPGTSDFFWRANALGTSCRESRPVWLCREKTDQHKKAEATRKHRMPPKRSYPTIGSWQKCSYRPSSLRQQHSLS